MLAGVVVLADDPIAVAEDRQQDFDDGKQVIDERGRRRLDGHAVLDELARRFVCEPFAAASGKDCWKRSFDETIICAIIRTISSIGFEINRRIAGTRAAASAMKLMSVSYLS